jgi:hypothetical protein
VSPPDPPEVGLEIARWFLDRTYLREVPDALRTEKRARARQQRQDPGLGGGAYECPYQRGLHPNRTGLGWPLVEQRADSLDRSSLPRGSAFRPGSSSRAEPAGRTTPEATGTTPSI